ncbi:MAG: SnoaL-like domain-containing protein [Bacteroidota bacterium]
MMTTQQVANRLVELARSGQFDACYDELFHPDAEAHEMEGMPNSVTKGLDNMRAKSEEWAKQVKEFHGVTVSDPLVAPGWFSVHMGIDITKMDGVRSTDQEICLYQVKDGKIVAERFFYDV